jgi:hypothetical protein
VYELSCPTCNTPSQYDFNDYLMMCPFCSATFKLDEQSGHKEIFADHFIVPATASPGQVKGLVMEWLRRLHHKPGHTESEYFVVEVNGLSIPYWIVSMEAHTAWKGLIKRNRAHTLEVSLGSDYLIEQGQFRRTYRWAITGRKNICETWGMTRLHEPKENIRVDWDGFPLDSTFSRGQIEEKTGNERNTYDAREFFEFKYANNLPILGIHTTDDEALRRANRHVDQYHLALSKLEVDYLIDYRTEIEIAGIQLVHLPFFHTRYVYRPKTALRHLVKSSEKNVLVDGYNNGILKGELAIHHRDKVLVNGLVCGVGTILFFLLGLSWHPAFYFVCLFSFFVACASLYISMARKAKREDEELAKKSIDVKASAPEAA